MLLTGLGESLSLLNVKGNKKMQMIWEITFPFYCEFLGKHKGPSVQFRASLCISNAPQCCSTDLPHRAQKICKNCAFLPLPSTKAVLPFLLVVRNIYMLLPGTAQFAFIPR